MKESLRILIVDDDEVDRKMIKRLLAASALEIVTHETASAEECLKLLQLTKVDCVLLDYRLPEMDGIEFLRQLRGSDRASAPAVVMMSGNGNERLVVQAMRLGVQDYLVKADITAANLEEAILHAVESTHQQHLARIESQRLEELALVDPLTGTGNRNFFNIRLSHAISRAGRQGEQIGLLYLDLNRFKEINDSLGHSAGDEVLYEVAQRLKATARDSDTVARLGGDEFAIIMETGVSDSGSQCLAHRIKEALSRPIAAAGRTVNVGISVGTAHYPQDAEDADTLIRAADAAMYEAKFGNRLDWDIKYRNSGT